MPLTVRNDADFKGMLLQRRTKPGQKYVLLLFRTEAGLRFCLSKNLSLVESMLIGRTYRVTGREHTTGHKTYLNMVSATLVRSKRAMFRKRIGLMASAASLVIIASAIGTSVFVHHNAAHNNQSDSPNVLIQSENNTNTPGAAGKIKSIINQKQSGSSSSKTPTSNTPLQSGGSTKSTPSPLPESPTPTPDPNLTPTPTPDPTPDPTPPPPTPEPTPEPTSPPPPADQTLVTPNSGSGQ